MLHYHAWFYFFLVGGADFGRCNDELDGAGWPFVKEMHLKLWPDEVWKNPFIEEEVESAGGEDLNVADHKGLAVRDKKN